MRENVKSVWANADYISMQVKLAIQMQDKIL